MTGPARAPAPPIDGPLRPGQARCTTSRDKGLNWATLVATGQLVPVDHGSGGDPAGRLAVWRAGPRSDWHARWLDRGEEPAPGETRAACHWDTHRDAPPKAARLAAS